MKFGYFCNSTNWNNQKKYDQILEEIREISIYCDQNNWDSIWFTEHHFSHEGMEICPNPLMLSADIKFMQISSCFDESSIKNDNLYDLALELSSSKAKNVMNKILELNLNVCSVEILGCDSIFEFNGKAFGKPSNKKEAYDRWQEMSSEYGYLHTGHTLIFCEINKSRQLSSRKHRYRNVQDVIY